MPRHFRATCWIAGCATLLAVVATAVPLQRRVRPSGDSVDTRMASPSRYLNSTPEVRYVGADRCANCHPEQHASYLQTAHRQAFAPVQLEETPPEGTFADARSERSYRIYQRDGELRHAETIHFRNDRALVVADHAMRYVVGSGRFSRSYLIEQDGYLFESPATWYAARSAWGLSPGYDRHNVGFQRPVDARCIHCHVGRVEPVENSTQRLVFHTSAIDCERCHGPGELHARKWDEGLAARPQQSADDLTIVHPGRLNRRAGEDICMQCHLHAAATVERPGRTLADFRPGDQLDEYAIHFRRNSSQSRMEVTGHGEQMRLSRCYLDSETLTCVTCHDPHVALPPESRIAWYRSKCLDCHAPSACGSPLEVRSKVSAGDDCVSCHMPTSPTEIPHFAFTHHRIGVHSSEPGEDSVAGSEQELEPLQQPPSISPSEARRNLALAYLQFSDTADGAAHAAAYRHTSKMLLELTDWKSDPEAAAALARLSLGTELAKTLTYAAAVDARSDASLDAAATAAYTRGFTLYELNRPAEAIPFLERAAAARPTADIWMMLSDCYQHTGELPKSLQAARNAVVFAPDRPRYRQRLYDLESTVGITPDSDEPETIRDLHGHWQRMRSKP